LLSKLEFDFETLNRIIDGSEITKQDAYEIFLHSESYSEKLFKTASILRDQNKGRIISFSKKAFFNIVNLCRDTCSYCTYKAEIGEPKLSMMNLEDVKKLAKQAKKFKCVEALLVTGESPEQKYDEAAKWLGKNGFSTTGEYLAHCSELVLKEGLFPHTNAGNLNRSEMNELKKTNVSMGLMLENSSQRLSEEGQPHYGAPSKDPKARIQILKNAGQLKIPMTTGILVGIGENDFEIIDSLFTIKMIQKQFGNIQEVILQNFEPKLDTQMKSYPSAPQEYFKRVVAISRIILPDMNIQIPPNLSPTNYNDFLDVGINDWGGISPLTLDYVNPEFSWPQISTLEKKCTEQSFELKARFPVYPKFINMINPNLKEKIEKLSDNENYVRREFWR
jgi:7,8-didemethyl-8-hydroxy-5-deazariboflavin synthase CofG subunit